MAILEIASHALERAFRFTLLVLALVVSYILISSVYNLFFHPLKHIPGPPLARVSRLWTRIGNYSGRKSHRIHDAHRQYGRVVRIGPNELSFSNPSAVREIYTSDVFVKEESFYRGKRVFVEEMLMSFRDREAHKSRRKLLARGFSQASMLDFEPFLTKKIQTLMNQWTKLSADGQPLNVYPWCLWLGFEAVYYLLFAADEGSLEKGQEPAVMKYLRAWRPLFTYKEFIPQLEQYGVYMPGNPGRNFRLVQEWKQYAVNLIRDLRQRGTKTPFLRYALSEEDVHLGRPLNDSELAEESMGGMFGGTGTTANTFVYLLYAVLRKPGAAQRLHKEVSQVATDPSQVSSYTELSKLPYLQACLNETLRLYPTIIASLPRTALRNTIVCGVHVPRGSICGSQNYTVHRDAEAFPDPGAFMPERWLNEKGELRDDEKMKAAFVPFSLGPRKCIGLNLAMMELVKVTAAFFMRFPEASIDPSMTEEDMEMFDCFSASPRGAKLILRLQK